MQPDAPGNGASVEREWKANPSTHPSFPRLTTWVIDYDTTQPYCCGNQAGWSFSGDTPPKHSKITPFPIEWVRFEEARTTAFRLKQVA